MPFLTADTLTHELGKDLWTVAAPLIYQSARYGVTITVPIGTTTDLASIPQELRGMISDDDANIVEAATLHDYLYQNNGILPEHTFTRAECDQTLLDAMKDCGSSMWKRDVVWSAVREFGFIAWEGYLRAKAK